MIIERCTSFGAAAVLVGGGGLLLTTPLALAGDDEPAIWYVDDDAGDAAGKGTSWGDPFKTIEQALAAAADSPTADIIRVAQGDYLPMMLTDPKDPRSRTLLINLPDVQVLGGYAGPGEPHPNWRKPALFPTTIDGAPKPAAAFGPNDACEKGDGDCYEPNGTPGCDNPKCCEFICGLDSFCCDVEWDEACAEFAGVFCELPGVPNAYHVVTIIGGGPEVVFDGFTLTGGDAHDAEIPGGGGMLIVNSDASVGRVIFTGNAGETGGALAIETEGPDAAARPFLYNLWFENNEASDRGGAIYNMGEPTIVNTVVVSNTARGTSFVGAGGGIFNGAQITLANSTVGWNLADSAVGGGVRNGPFGGVNVVNSILWGNEDVEGDAVTAQVSGGVIFVDYSNVQDGAGSFPEGEGNIATTPGFINPPFEPGGELTGGDGEINLGLLPVSPCIDAGSNSLVPLDVGNLDHDYFDGGANTEPVPLDVNDQLRFVDNLDVPDDGKGKMNITDMGAVEFPTVLGDLTGDGYVAPRDLAILLAAWGLCPGPGCVADLAVNGVVFDDDLAVIIQNWNPPRGMGGLKAPGRDEIELPR